MARRGNKRLQKNVLDDDLYAYAALQAIADYVPANEAFSLASIRSVKTSMDGKQTSEVQLQNAADAGRDDTVAEEWNFHDKILGAKDQIKAQYGADSNEYQSLGMKKKSEYKTGRRKVPSNDGGTT